MGRCRMLSRTTRQTDKAIAGLASDNLSGAAEILRRASAIFFLLSDELSHQPSLSIEEAHQSLRKTCITLARAQPDMSSLLRLSSEALSAARAEASGREALKHAADAAREFVEAASGWAHAAALRAANLIPDGSKLLTHSRSSTVLEALVEARRARKHFEVFATESRPLFEGRTLAAELSKEGIHVTLIADSAASLFIELADLIVTGADKITPENLVNKIGTKMIALSARERCLPIYAICDTSKFIAADYFADAIRDQRNAGQLWPDAPEGLVISNKYFEPTPLVYFTGVVTEGGALSSAEASACAAEPHVDSVLVDALRNRPDEFR